MSSSEWAKDTQSSLSNPETEATRLLPGYSIYEAQRLLGVENVSMAYLYSTYNLPDLGVPESKLIDHHRKDHFGRMLTLSVPSLTLLKQNKHRVSHDDIECVQWFTVLHDAFLTNQNYEEHGITSALYVLGVFGNSIVPEHLREKLAIAIAQHVPDDTSDMSFLARVAKEIDAIDRTRFHPFEDLKNDHLKYNYLRFKESELLIPLSEALHERTLAYMQKGQEPFIASLLSGRDLGILSD